MDLSPFLVLKLHSSTKPPPLSGVHPSTTSCFCKVRINTFPTHTALLPFSALALTPDTATSALTFHLDPAALCRFPEKPLILVLSIYNNPMSRSY
ncbi:uncharacterized protein HKW66_Vig0192310 [Vigna angularis]|uniref:Uncharacterized protein n=1 Tax=Phaseolus angularis TaxID=3914 RepID=A0A8T0KRJ3_PHAAN|nr:uncharacterized protein HKW66_Vig0192310 [Vigna angularis]